MGWRDISVNFQRLSQKLATLASTPNPSRLREGKVLNWSNFQVRLLRLTILRATKLKSQPNAHSHDAIIPRPQAIPEICPTPNGTVMAVENTAKIMIHTVSIIAFIRP